MDVRGANVKRHRVALLPTAIGSRTGPNRVEIPLDIRLEDHEGDRFITWTWNKNPEGPRIAISDVLPFPEVRFHPRLFWQFSRLADASDETIFEYARIWGPLELCADHLYPAAHELSEIGSTYREDYLFFHNPQDPRPPIGSRADRGS